MDAVTECKDELTMEEAKEEVSYVIIILSIAAITLWYRLPTLTTAYLFRPHLKIAIQI